MGFLTPKYPEGAEPAREPTRRERRATAADDATRADRERLRDRREELAGITTEAERKAWRAMFDN